VVDEIAMVRWTRAAFLVLLLAGASCSGGDADGRQDVGFTIVSVNPTSCVEGSGVAECYDVAFRNEGTDSGSGSCRLNPRRGSDAVFPDGTDVIQLREVAPGGTVRSQVTVHPNARGRYVFPSTGCDPGLRA